MKNFLTLACLLFAFLTCQAQQPISNTNVSWRVNSIDDTYYLFAWNTNKAVPLKGVSIPLSMFNSNRAQFGTITNYGTNKFQDNVRFQGHINLQDTAYIYAFPAAPGRMHLDCTEVSFNFAATAMLKWDSQGFYFANGATLVPHRAKNYQAGGFEGIRFTHPSDSNNVATGLFTLAGLSVPILTSNWLQVVGTNPVSPGNLITSNLVAEGNFTNKLASRIPTNMAPALLYTNQMFSFDAVSYGWTFTNTIFYTNLNQRAWVQQSVSFTCSSNQIGTLYLLVDDNNDGTPETIISPAIIAPTSPNYQTVLTSGGWVQPNQAFRWTINVTGGSYSLASGRWNLF